MVDILVSEELCSTTEDALNDVREMIEDELESNGFSSFGAHPVDISTIRIRMEDSQRDNGKAFFSLSREDMDIILMCLDHTEHRLLEQREECEPEDFDYFRKAHADAQEAHEFFEGVYKIQVQRGW